MKKFIYTTNNAYDTLLIVDESNKVVSSWTVTPEVIADYLASGRDCSDWDLNYPENESSLDYGEEIEGEKLEERINFNK